MSRVQAGGDVNITQVAGRMPALPLVPPFSDVADVDTSSETSLLESMRASQRRVRNLVGRERMVAAADAWRSNPGEAAATGLDHRVLVIHGPGGAGKTRLASEILSRGAETGWTSGFLIGTPPLDTDWASLSHPTEPLMVAIDYAEARHDDIQRLLGNAPIGHDGEAPLRLILIVREGKAPSQSWADRLAGGHDLGDRAERLLADRAVEVFSLDESIPELSDRRDLWLASYKSFSDRDTEPPAHLDDALFDRPLFILLDSYREFRGERGSETPSAEELIRRVLRHERQYWIRSQEEHSLSLDIRRMNQVAAIATLFGGVGRDSFEEVLGALDWLRHDSDLRRCVTDWWCTVYATDSGLIRGVEPDIVGEHLVMRALGDTEAHSRLAGALDAAQLAALIESASITARQRALRVLTRIGNGQGATREAAKTILAQILSKHLDDFLPSTFWAPAEISEYDGVGESVATTVASAILASDQLHLVVGEARNRNGEDPKKVPGDEASATARNAALKLIRQQVEQVADRELNAGRWTAERFAQIYAWTLRLELEAGVKGRGEEKIARVSALAPRPHRVLARMRLDLARALDSPEKAEALLQDAIAELEAAGESDSGTARAIARELAIAADQRDERELALERHERLLERELAAGGFSNAHAVTTLLSITWLIGADDPARALARLAEAERTMLAAGSEERQLERVREGRASAKLSAARAAERDARLEEAERLYLDAKAELAALGKADEYLTYVIDHDLGDVAEADGSLEVALEHYERALEGKTRTGSISWSGRIVTFLAVVETLVDLRRVDEALARLAAEYEALKANSSPALESVFNVWVDLLADQGQLSEAAAVGRDFNQLKLARELRRTIFEAAVDSTVYAPLPVALAIDCCLMAARIFPPGDPRLVPLASRFGHLLIVVLTELGGHYMRNVNLSLGEGDDADDPDDEIGWLLDGISMLQADAVDLAAAVVRESPAVLQLWSSTPAHLCDELDLLAADPLIGALRTQRGKPGDAGLTLADDPAVRRWLTRSAREVGVSMIPAIDAALVACLVGAYVKIRQGEFERPPTGESVAAFWRETADGSSVSEECARVEAEFRAFGDDPQTASTLVRTAPAAGLLSAGRMVETAGEFAEAERLYESALDALGSIESPLRHVIEMELGDIAAHQGDSKLALDRYREALAGLEETFGLTSDATITAGVNLVRQIARADVDGGLAKAEELAARVRSAGAKQEQVKRLEQIAPSLLHEAAEAAVERGDWRPAEELCHRATEELSRRGEEKTRLAYVIEHTCAEAAAGQGDTDKALERFERSLAGKERLGAVGEEETTTNTLFALARTLATRDLGAAHRRIESAERTLLEAGTSDDVLARVRRGAPEATIARARFEEQEGRLETAESLFRAALGELASIGDCSYRIGMIWQALGDVASARDRHDVALECYERALSGRRQIYGRTHPHAMNCLTAALRAQARLDFDATFLRWGNEMQAMAAEGAFTQRSHIYRELPILLLEAGRANLASAQLEAAAEHLENAQSFLLAHGLGASALFHTIEHERGVILAKLGDWEGALECYERAAAGDSEAKGATEIDTMTSTIAAISHIATRDPAEALKRLDAELWLIRASGASPAEIEHLARKRPRLLAQVGQAARERGEFDRATFFLVQARDAWSEFDPHSSCLAEYDLGRIAIGAGDRELAVERLERSLAGLKDLGCHIDEPGIQIHIELIAAKARLDVANGLEFAVEALSALEQAQAPEAARSRIRSGRAVAWHAAARVAASAGEHGMAIEHLQAALEALAQTEWEDSIFACELQEELAIILASCGELDLALPHFIRSYEGKRELLGIGDQSTVATMSKLVAALRVERPEEALERIEQTRLAMLEAEVPKEQIERFLAKVRPSAIRLLARQRREAGQLEEAEMLFERARADLNFPHGVGDAIIEADLAKTALLRGDRARARKRIEDALTALTDAAGATGGAVGVDEVLWTLSILRELDPERATERGRLAIDRLGERGASAEQLSRIETWIAEPQESREARSADADGDGAYSEPPSSSPSPRRRSRSTKA